jgi:hypothetical protein
MRSTLGKTWQAVWRRKDGLVLALCFAACCMSFSEVIVSLVIGFMTWVTYEILWRRNRKMILAVVSAVVSLAALEYFGGVVIRARVAGEYDPDIDHRMKPNPAMGINSDGIRCSVEAGDFTADTFNIVLLGDSYTYGIRIDQPADTFAGRLEALANAAAPKRAVRTVNFGWTSSSPLLSFRLLRDIGQKYHPALVVLCLDLSDFHDDLRYQVGAGFVGASPLQFLIHRMGLADEFILLRGRWVLADYWRRLARSRAVIPPERFFITNRPLEESRPFLGPVEENIRAIHRHCRDALGCEFVLVLTPRSYQYSDRECPANWEADNYTVLGPYVKEPEKWLASFQETVDFPCHSLLEDMRRATAFPLYFGDDPHWTEAGHEVIARGLLRVLKEDGLLP